MIYWAKITHQFSGVHNWPGARPGSEHSYLANSHRHLFHVTIWIQQFHDDRDVEYLECKDWLMSVCSNKEMYHRSCEMIAAELLGKVRTKWGANRRVKVEVLEDGENGALVEGEG